MGNVLAKILLTVMIVFLVLLTAIKFEILTIPEGFFGKSISDETSNDNKDDDTNIGTGNKVECLATQKADQTLGGTQGDVKSDITYVGEFENNILTIITTSSVSNFTTEQNAEITMLKGFMDAMLTAEMEKYSGFEYRSTLENNTITFYMKHDLKTLNSQGYFEKREDGTTTSLTLGEKDNAPEIKPGSINKTVFVNTLQSEGYTCK